MGYHIDYTLSYTGTSEAFDMALKLLKRPTNVIQAVTDKSYLFDGEKVSQEEMDEAMIVASSHYPSLTFKVHAEGEEAGDISDHYYRNGKKASYYAEVVVPKFNEDDFE